VANWHGPRDDCGCCAIICGCENDATLRSPSFFGTPTVKITISGLPDKYEWSHVRFVDFVAQKTDWTLDGLSGANGTYFFALSKRNAFCIDENAGSGISDLIAFTETRVVTTRVFLQPCDISSTSTFTASRNLDFTANVSSSVIAAGVGDQYGVRGHIEWSCPEYDYTTSTATNELRIFGPFGSARTWPRSTGEIKIRRLAIQLAECDWDAESSDGEVFETIGLITAEILDL
jgi:hypothetical protein